MQECIAIEDIEDRACLLPPEELDMVTAITEARIEWAIPDEPPVEDPIEPAELPPAPIWSITEGHPSEGLILEPMPVSSTLHYVAPTAPGATTGFIKFAVEGVGEESKFIRLYGYVADPAVPPFTVTTLAGGDVELEDPVADTHCEESGMMYYELEFEQDDEVTVLVNFTDEVGAPVEYTPIMFADIESFFLGE